MNGFRMSTRYAFVRARELEGTFPGDGQTGTWPITAQRITYGWGTPPEWSWPYGTDWPPPEPPGIDLIAKKHRFLWPYRRVRTIADCKEIRGGDSVLVSLDITDKWANPWHGQIPAPSASDIRLPTMHAVTLVGFNPSRDEFKFINSWGPSWGDEGYGYIRAERLSATWSEGWQGITTPIERTPLIGVSPNLRYGAIKLRDGSTFHWLEFVDEEDERLGWASAVQSSTTFEIEELFVRPRYRGAGYGKKLFQTIETMAKDLSLPMRMWISFADTAPQNLKLLEKIAGPSGLIIQPSGVRWASLVAVPASDRMVEPAAAFLYPETPPSVPNELVKWASGVAISFGTSIAANLVYDVLKSWMDPKNHKRIKAKLADLELETEEVSVDEFRKLFKDLKNVKNGTDIRTKILEAGIKIIVVKPPTTDSSVDDQ